VLFKSCDRYEYKLVVAESSVSEDLELATTAWDSTLVRTRAAMSGRPSSAPLDCFRNGMKGAQGSRDLRNASRNTGDSTTFQNSSGSRHGHTLDQVLEQDQQIQDDVLPLGSRLQDTGLVLPPQEQRDIVGGLGLEDELAGVLADLVDGLYFLEMGLGDGLCADGALPGDRAGADVVLERADELRRVDRHGFRCLMAVGVEAGGDKDGWCRWWGFGSCLVSET
jgi:hypothetical protein